MRTGRVNCKSCEKGFSEVQPYEDLDYCIPCWGDLRPKMGAMPLTGRDTFRENAAKLKEELG